MSVNFYGSFNDSLLLYSSLPFNLDCLILESRTVFIMVIFTNISFSSLSASSSSITVSNNGENRAQPPQQQYQVKTPSPTTCPPWSYFMSLETSCYYGIFRINFPMLIVWYCLFCFCLVFPITYLSLRKKSAIRIRNLIIGCIWLFSFGVTIIIILENSSIVVDLCLLTSSMIIMSFCSFSVLSSDSSWPRGSGQGSRKGWPIEAEGFLHHCGHTGGAVVEMCLESDVGCSGFV